MVSEYTAGHEFTVSSAIPESVSKRTVRSLLAVADIQVDGSRPWDIHVHNDEFYHRAITQGSVGVGEAYMDGWWTCNRLDEFFYRICIAGVHLRRPLAKKEKVYALLHRMFNFQTKSRSRIVGEAHYDLGNGLFERMLDSTMSYSCGYWKEADTLEAAQLAKLDLICRKLDLRPGMRLLDIGCGWGGMAEYAARRYGAEVVGVTISKAQHALAVERCKGLPVKIRFQDYRELEEPFDRIVSIGMFEHVGYKNHQEYMKVADRCLRDDGLFLLHTIGSNDSDVKIDAWMDHYIFPNAALPSIGQIGKAIEGRFIMEDWQNFGPDYDKTLMAWHRNFVSRYNEIRDRYDSRFFRMWNYYLLGCAGGFRARYMQLWQIVLAKDARSERYDAPR